MNIVLITGGNKGLGYETARRLIELGYKVWIGCRDKQAAIRDETILKPKRIILL